MTPARRAWRESFGIYRAASRVLMTPGAMETVSQAVTSMRALSGNWEIPRKGYSQNWTRHGVKLAGPYLSGRRFLRRT